LQIGQVVKQGIAVGAGQFGGGGRGGGAQVGRKIGDGEIGFMADAGDDGDRRGVDGAGNAFFIEGPEVFDAAAAATDDDRVAIALASLFDGVGNFGAGTFTLDGRGKQRDRNVRCAPVQRGQHIAQRSGLRAGDNGEAPRETG
jgi:hypothetical protein